ncbi:multidrug resistance-associated ABC transporter [Coniophora puteana RWD-64-598 SS2]|uniref:Multidrug resistance-associated ABC transporter n=1 Tax=Coniophora puteana (strain RWD-64-598) TaxID=741705 RepID=A0A5M3MI51_CONPW|nr:multidrug resistance-associated ABC transporter [Coniophora puteana RWD-64-598 SS2]EIW78464.1 multidrug resistance-associated ABC transporter [Coniophora puteana RWD-64-598 SS2]
MSGFELPAAAVLAVSGALSFVVITLSELFTSPRRGYDKVLTSRQLGEDIHTVHDPFDISRPEDEIEGYAIDEDAFWNKARLRKRFLSINLAVVLAFQCMGLAYSYIHSDVANVLVYILQATYALYTAGLAAFSIYQSVVDTHANSLVHLSALTFLPTALLGILTILPSAGMNNIVLMQHTPAPLFLSTLRAVTVVGYFSAAVLAWSTPTGPALFYPPEDIYTDKISQATTNLSDENVCGYMGASSWSFMLFSYTTKVVNIGYNSASLDIADLPIVPLTMRSTYLYAQMKTVMRRTRLRFCGWRPRPGSGWQLMYRLIRANFIALVALLSLAVVAAVMYYAPPYFLEKVVQYLESDPERSDRGWGWFYVLGLFLSNALSYLISNQVWSLSTTTTHCRIRVQLNSILFAKTLLRKDVASASAPQAQQGDSIVVEKKNEEDFSSKAQVMTLMTTDVDRVSDFAWHMFSLVDAPIEILIGTLFLYRLLGVSCFVGLGAIMLFIPLNHYGGRVLVRAQEKLMKARDERVSLMNEILGAMRMLKFMAWERSFEKRVMRIRERELRSQKRTFLIEVLFNGLWDASPVLVTIISFWHFAMVRQQTLTPSIAFTSIQIFSLMKFALNALPETFINMLQSFVSLRRIEKYLQGSEVKAVPLLSTQPTNVSLNNATITWPRDRGQSLSAPPSAASTPRYKFLLSDLTLSFPTGELSLICGKLGSGKSLLLLGLLGEADLLTGQIICPRSPPDILASFARESAHKEDWIVQGACGYVPQTPWLRNASIKENILFNLPYNEERYRKTLRVCALMSDLNILEDGDESEVGESGVNLSGGQKARISLARAVYSRASVLFLDDVLSAVDAHTAHHLYYECLKGELMRSRTIVLVSHHVQLCSSGASYVVALDNGRVSFQGTRQEFYNSSVMSNLVHSGDTLDGKEQLEEIVPISSEFDDTPALTPTSEIGSDSASTIVNGSVDFTEKKPARKVVEEEKRAVGHIGKDIWVAYVRACGGWAYWLLFVLSLLIGALSPVLENWWLKSWSGAPEEESARNGAGYYISIYAGVTIVGLILTVIRFWILYAGSISASKTLYKNLLETVLLANLRFHDTVSRGRLLNRFGKDFEGIDSTMSDNFGRSVMYGLAVLTTIITISSVGGIPFFLATLVLGYMYYQVAKVYGQTSRDMRRLDSVTRSPLYSIYGETISGVTVIRAFGAPSKFLRDMLRCVDTNANPYYWMWSVNRWLSARFNLLSAVLVGLTGFVAVLYPGISAALAGFTLSFASNLTNNLLFLVRRFVALEQSMVALERVNEFTQLKREAAEFTEPRPSVYWPEEGAISCQDLVVRYAPDLPNVLHHLNFDVRPGEKIGVLGRTGSGKSTLALSFFRFVEATEGRIVIDGIDISQIGLTDLRSKLTIIPQDPTILSGTLRSTLDVFNEYEDAEIYEALRRVHLIASSKSSVEDLSGDEDAEFNGNVFRNLDSPVSEGGENFSTGEKQLLCMARAILKRSRVLVMDEATASVDYATDELISRTIKQEFASSTILTIAHRLRTIIDYDRVMVLDEGRIAEFDRPATLLQDPTSHFYSLCEATGRKEFVTLKKLAGL